MTTEQAILKAQKELKEHEGEWVERYSDYLTKTAANKDKILEKRKKFHKWANLSVYSSLGKAKDNSNTFDLRYEGQSVGEIKVDRKGEVYLYISPEQYKNNTNENYIKGYPKEICLTGTYPWHSKQAAVFRTYFKEDPGKNGHPEHKYENLLLKELSRKDSAEKSLVNIQPVTIGTTSDLFFQMPTPLSASGSDIVYSGGRGGIDILARRNKRLTVIELKDEYKKEEGPEKVITQAIAYATFLVEICNTKAREDFWKVCGFKGKPDGNETINVAIMMPDPGDGSIPPFAGDILNVPGSQMKLELHYIYFNKETIKITRTSL